MTGPVSYRELTGNAAENYQRDFVPAIALPASGPLLQAAELQAGERVLDVACGTGLIARQAAEQVGATGAVTGVDITPEMLAVASAEPSPIDWRLGDAAALPLDDEAFDVVLCQLGLMFMDDRPAAVAEMHRVLVPGGRLVVSTGGAIQPVFELLDQVLVDHIDPQLGRFVQSVFALRDPETLTGLARTAGFRDVEVTVHEVDLRLPPPAEFLWMYINLTPMAPLVAQAPESARLAMESRFVAATTPAHTTPTGGTKVRQPLVLTTGRR